MSSTTNNDSVFLIGVVGAHAGIVIGILYIATAFLHADNDEHTVMLLCGKLCELLVQVDPKLYHKDVITSKKGVPMLYVKLNRALYGLLKAALLFYKKFRGRIEEMGFVINLYDPCVTNKMVNYLQMSIVWHTDKLKVSHLSK